MSAETPADGAPAPAPAGPESGHGLSTAGRLAVLFQTHTLTPLLAIVILLAGAMAVLLTPREEEPQIDVTMAQVLLPFPGASAADVQNMVALPAEQVLGQIAGIEHTYSVSQAGMAMVTVQFQVGVPRTEALVRVYDVLNANQDWLPRNLGALPPLVKPRGIDDVPVMAVTLWPTADAAGGAVSEGGAELLERIALAIEPDLKRVNGVREVRTLGGPGRIVNVTIDPQRLRARGIDLLGLRRALAGASQGLPSGQVLDAEGGAGHRMLAVETGEFLRSADDVAGLVVGVHAGRPVYLREVADISAGPAQPQRQVWFTPGSAAATDLAAAGAIAGSVHPAVTLAITKKPGANAVDVTRALRERLHDLRNTALPAGVQATITRDYGETAADKATQLIRKLAFATGAVVVLVGLALGRREALIVGAAVVLTLAATLFASWAWGFTLNRVSLFALIFSIGILVDDAIVVVENIHRHQHLHPERSLAQIIPAAVDEVGGPTILATLAVIAALLPMAFVSGLMGPYMSPIPINASLGMALSLAIAFTVTPWLALRLMKPLPSGHGKAGALPEAVTPGRLGRFFAALLTPLLERAARRWALAAGVATALVLSAGLAAVPGWPIGVVMKMLPFDNKSEFQVLVQMPQASPLEDTAATLQAMGAFLARQPEVQHLQGHAGMSGPITFNGLVRQYDLRTEPVYGDLQVNLVPKSERDEQSHAIAQRLRPALEALARARGARVQVVEVPPGPPVRSPIVAEVYGPDEDGRRKLAERLQRAFAETPDIVAVDSSLREPSPQALLQVRRAQAAALGIAVTDVAETVHAALSGIDAAYLHDGVSRLPVPVRLQLPREQQVGLTSLLALPMRGAGSDGRAGLVPLGEVVQVDRAEADTPRYTKDLLGMSWVMGDVGAGGSTPDSPLYGLFALREPLQRAAAPGTGGVDEYWVRAPADPYRAYAVKWDGEWQITYETFRDMGAAYAVGLVLIYLLVVAQFRSYVVPLVIMVPIPLTLIGVMPGHAMLGAPFTATSMIGMIALAGIIVRNSILMVDFVDLQVRRGIPLRQAVIDAAAVRAQPIALTALAAMLGALFILDDPIFSGLAISLVFGIGVSTVLTLVVIPVLYFAAFRRGDDAGAPSAPGAMPVATMQVTT